MIALFDINECFELLERHLSMLQHRQQRTGALSAKHNEQLAFCAVLVWVMKQLRVPYSSEWMLPDDPPGRISGGVKPALRFIIRECKNLKRQDVWDLYQVVRGLRAYAEARELEDYDEAVDRCVERARELIAKDFRTWSIGPHDGPASLSAGVHLGTVLRDAQLRKASIEALTASFNSEAKAFEGIMGRDGSPYYTAYHNSDSIFTIKTEHIRELESQAEDALAVIDSILEAPSFRPDACLESCLTTPHEDSFEGEFGALRIARTFQVLADDSRKSKAKSIIVHTMQHVEHAATIQTETAITAMEAVIHCDQHMGAIFDLVAKRAPTTSANSPYPVARPVAPLFSTDRPIFRQNRIIAAIYNAGGVKDVVDTDQPIPSAVTLDGIAKAVGAPRGTSIERDMRNLFGRRLVARTQDMKTLMNRRGRAFGHYLTPEGVRLAQTFPYQPGGATTLRDSNRGTDKSSRRPSRDPI